MLAVSRRTSVRSQAVWASPWPGSELGTCPEQMLEGLRTRSQEIGSTPLSQRASVFPSVKWARGCGRNQRTDRLQGRRLRGKGAAAGYLRGRPAAGCGAPGSPGASSGFLPCVSGGAGPWLTRRVSAPRLLPRLLGSGVKAGVGDGLGDPGHVRPGDKPRADHPCPGFRWPTPRITAGVF